MKTLFYSMLLVMSIASTICDGQSKQQGSLEEAKKAIAESNARYFVLYAKNDGSVVNLYTDDACLFVPGAGPTAFCGHAAIGKFFKEGYEVVGLKSGKFTTTNVYGDGIEYVTEEGLSQMFDASGKLYDEGKYLVLWKKTKGGWKMYKDIFNSNQAPKK